MLQFDFEVINVSNMLYFHRPDSSLSGGKYSRKSPYENLDVVGCYSKMVLTIDSNTSMV